MRVRIGLPLPFNNDTIGCIDSIHNLLRAYPEIEWEVIECNYLVNAQQNKWGWALNWILKYGHIKDPVNLEEEPDYYNAKFDKILFLDEEIRFTPEDFKTLLDADLPVVTGHHWMEHGGLSGWDYDEDYDRVEQELKGSIVKVENVGLDFCLIDKSVFQNINEINGCPFSPPYTRAKGFLRSDSGFSKSCREAGIPIYLHNDVKVTLNKGLPR